MYSIAIPHVSNPHPPPPSQMTNCVNQRMEFQVFERVADRDYSSRVMAVRWDTKVQILWPSHSFKIPSTCDLIVVLETPLLSCTFLTNPPQTLTDPNDPNISDPMDSHGCNSFGCLKCLIEQRNVWGKKEIINSQPMIAERFVIVLCFACQGAWESKRWLQQSWQCWFAACHWCGMMIRLTRPDFKPLQNTGMSALIRKHSQRKMEKTTFDRHIMHKHISPSWFVVTAKMRHDKFHGGKMYLWTS